MEFQGAAPSRPFLFLKPYNRFTMKKVVHAACPHDCPDACGVLITVEDGRATRIQGDSAHPVTRGFLCAKVAKYLDRVYSPDRVFYPMRRVRPKGANRETDLRSVRTGPFDFAQGRLRPVPTQSVPIDSVGEFERISWDEALDEISLAIPTDWFRFWQ